MKKLILAIVLCVASIGTASAGGVDLGPFGTAVYVRGGFNFFSLLNPMTYNGEEIYFAEISLDAGEYEFNIASEDFATVLLQNIDSVPTFSPPATVDAGRGPFGNFWLEIFTPGTYLFSLDVSSIFSGEDLDGPFPLTVSAVPVPGAGLLLFSALGGLGFLRRRS